MNTLASVSHLETTTEKTNSIKSDFVPQKSLTMQKNKELDESHTKTVPWIPNQNYQVNQSGI